MNIYQNLLNKGFKLYVYTDREERLFYRKDIENKELIDMILNSKGFGILDGCNYSLHEDLKIIFECEIDLKGFKIIFTSDEINDNETLNIQEFEELLRLLPNEYMVDYI